MSAIIHQSGDWVAPQALSRDVLYFYYKMASPLKTGMKRVCIGLLICAWPRPLLGQSHSPAMFRADPQHTGVYETKGVRRLHGVKWKFKTGRVVEAWFSSPTVSDGIVYVGSDDHYLYALNAQT